MLPAFAAERRRLLHGARSTAHLLQARGSASDRYLHLSAGRSAANRPHTAALFDRWDRPMDGRTLDRFIDPAPHTIGQRQKRLLFDKQYVRALFHSTSFC